MSDKKGLWNLLSRNVSITIENTLTHNTSKDISKDESPNTDPQDDVNLYSDRINHLDKISQDIIPVIQSKELKQSNKSISESAAI